MRWLRHSSTTFFKLLLGALGLWVASGCEPSGSNPLTPDSKVEIPAEQVSRENHSEAPVEQQGFLIEVEISGFENRDGMCRVAAYASEVGFPNPDKAVTRSVLPIEGDLVRWSFRWPVEAGEAPPKSLAISAYHDQNDNGQLDKSLIGMPTEPYGFSNNPKRGYGPPTFEQAVVEAPADGSDSARWRIPVILK